MRNESNRNRWSSAEEHNTHVLTRETRDVRVLVFRSSLEGRSFRFGTLRLRWKRASVQTPLGVLHPWWRAIRVRTKLQRHTVYRNTFASKHRRNALGLAPEKIGQEHTL